MYTRHYSIKTRIFLIAAISLLSALLMSSCGNTLTGEEIYSLNIYSIDDEWWCLRPDREKMGKEIILNRIGQNGSESPVCTFKWAYPPVYSPYDKLFYYIENNKLFSLNPNDGMKEEICMLDNGSRQIDCITEQYILIKRNNRSAYMIDKDALHTSDKDSYASLACYYDSIAGSTGGTLFLWDNDAGNLLLYDCAAYQHTVLYHDDSNANANFQACLLNDSVYFFGRSDGTLMKADFSEGSGWNLSTPVESMDGLPMIAMTSVNDGLLCAVRGKGRSTTGYAVDFYLISGYGTVTQIAGWQDARYYLDGSLKMAVHEHFFACCITTNADLYYSEFVLP